MMILSIDKSAGLPYAANGPPITEEEFNVAHAKGIPIYVFVRQEVWVYSQVYHRQKKNKPITKEKFSELGIKGDIEVYEFIDRLQHLTTPSGAKAIPWIRDFSTVDDIVEFMGERKLEQCNSVIQRRVIDPIEENEIFADIETTVKIYTDAEFLDMLRKYKDSLPDSSRLPLYGILSYAWSAIVFNPFLAQATLSLLNDWRVECSCRLC
jgi:hypothetical protein